MHLKINIIFCITIDALVQTSDKFNVVSLVKEEFVVVVEVLLRVAVSENRSQNYSIVVTAISFILKLVACK